MDQQFETVSKFDRAVGGLLSGNNLHTKPTTVEHIEKVKGESETYIVRTIRDEDGDHVVIKYIDKDGTQRIILPPKVAQVIQRQKDSLSRRSRSNSSKARMKERMDGGWRPSFAKKS